MSNMNLTLSYMPSTTLNALYLQLIYHDSKPVSLVSFTDENLKPLL